MGNFSKIYPFKEMKPKEKYSQITAAFYSSMDI